MAGRDTISEASLFQVKIGKQISTPEKQMVPSELERDRENRSSDPNQTSERKALIVENRANCRLKLMRGKGQMRYRAVRPERIQRRWKFLNPDLHPGRGPHVPCPGEWGGSQAVRNRPQNEEGLRTKVTRIAMEKSTKLKQLKTAKILTYENGSSMEKIDEAWEAQKSGR